MTDDLNPIFALAKQSLDELFRLVSPEDLARCQFGSGAKHDRVAELLKKLNTQISSVRRALSAVVATGSSPPVIYLPPAHRAFWNDILAPQASLLQRSYFHISGLGILADWVDRPSLDEKRGQQKLNAISWGLERWVEMLDEDELFQWLDRGFDIEGAQDLVAMPWFQPDEWSQNMGLLQPVLVDRQTTVMRDHVRYRLIEIYRAFSFGLWMSAIALSRSLVEFSLRSCASRFGVSTTWEGSDGRPEEKSLKRLGEDIALRLPALAVPVDVVRETGNRILHPKKQHVIAHPRVMRSEALECIQAARAVVETVYSEPPPT